MSLTVLLTASLSRLALSEMGNENVDVLCASEGVKLAFVAVCSSVGSADWSPVPQASLVADLLGGNDGFCDAGSTESD